MKKSLLTLIGILAINYGVSQKPNEYLVLGKDTIPNNKIISHEIQKDERILYDTLGHFRKVFETKNFLKYLNENNDTIYKNNIQIRYLQHRNFDEKAIKKIN